jgi:hypothetical protein
LFFLHRRTQSRVNVPVIAPPSGNVNTKRTPSGTVESAVVEVAFVLVDVEALESGFVHASLR